MGIATIVFSDVRSTSRKYANGCYGTGNERLSSRKATQINAIDHCRKTERDTGSKKYANGCYGTGNERLSSRRATQINATGHCRTTEVYTG